MRAAVSTVAWATLLLYATFVAGQQPLHKEKPDPEKFALRLEVALLIENPEQKAKALLLVATDAAEDGQSDVVKKCLAALPETNASAEGVAAVMLKLVGSGRQAEALEAVKGLKAGDLRDRVLAQMVEGLAVGPDALWKAAETGHNERVAALLKAGVPVNAKDRDGQTALMKAAAQGHVAVVKVLLGQKAELSEADVKGETALMKAVANGHEGVFQLFFDHVREDGKSVLVALFNAADRGGVTILMKAAAGGHHRLVTKLRGMWMREAFSSAEFIVRDGVKDARGRTALEHAEEGGHEKVVELLKSSRGSPGKE